MKERKTTVKFFTIADWKKEEKYLTQMHQKGWRFERITIPFFYHFVKCEPKEVVYQLDYYQPGVLENREEYFQMFSDCGWEYILDFVGYSYFRKPVEDMKGNEEIFCDLESRMDMIQRSYKGKLTPLIVIFFCCLIPQMLLQYNLNASFNRVLFWMFVALMIIYICIFVVFGAQYYKIKKQIKDRM